jgi:PPOX class probable F420-dependent enzyme
MTMTTKQGDLGLLRDPIAQQLLHSTEMAHLAYVREDGAPRVVPIWFHWNGTDIVFASFPGAPKLETLTHESQVAISIDTNTWPYRVLLIRGAAEVTTVDGMVPEYEAAVYRYLGNEQGKAWVETVRNLTPQMGRVVVRPSWVGILDFEQRFPSAVEAAMARA